MTASILLVKLPEPKRARQKVSYVPPIGLWSIAHNLRDTGAEVDVIEAIKYADRVAALERMREGGPHGK